MSLMLTPAHNLLIGIPIFFAMYPPAIFPIAPVGNIISITISTTAFEILNLIGEVIAQYNF